MSEDHILRSYSFRAERESLWLELESMVEVVEKKGLRALTSEQLERLPALYRSGLSSLAVARSISLDKNVIDYLESLCARAYLCVYGNKVHLRETFATFFLQTWPRAVRAMKWPLLLAAVCLLLGTLTAYMLVSQDGDNFYSLVDAAYSQGRDPAASTESLKATLYDSGHDSGELTEFASSLFSHNARIGMMAFALGFIFGIPVVYLMFANGLILGAFLALFHGRGLGADLVAWLLPHGVTELLAVVLCGGAGLVLARALIFPGRHSRMANLAIRGRETGAVVLGAVLMFFLAGLIEGIFRQSVTSLSWRWVMIGITATFWIGYFGFVGRKEAEVDGN